MTCSQLKCKSAQINVAFGAPTLQLLSINAVLIFIYMSAVFEHLLYLGAVFRIYFYDCPKSARFLTTHSKISSNKCGFRESIPQLLQISAVLGHHLNNCFQQVRSFSFASTVTLNM
ncbi:unnamed protein product [Paramecium octaurelia]|uniref:Uncharacterized protein n=1 Tax=Paramecium octaurelia TaxID=43137 RepID=A0A8S1SH38_PAROT|nr:unnamed protein product [Paramecium octaurelia]